MAFPPDKIPAVVKAYKNLEPFRPDMALILGIGAPEKTVHPFEPSLNLGYCHCCPLLGNVGLGGRKKAFPRILRDWAHNGRHFHPLIP